MRAGRLRHRITLQRYVAVQDAYGQPAEAWEAFAIRWADVSPVMGREYFAAQQTTAQANYRIRLRYDIASATINRRDRVLWSDAAGQHLLDVEDVQNVHGRGEEIILMCSEVAE